MKAVVTAGDYVDRGLATASWWDRYELAPGEYPVWWSAIDGRQVPPGDLDLYYGQVSVLAVLAETYRENRIFSEVRAVTERPGTLSVVTLRPYAFQVKAGLTLANGLVTLADGDVRPYDEGNRCRGCRRGIDWECAPGCTRMFVWQRAWPAATTTPPHECDVCGENALVQQGRKWGYRHWRCASCGRDHLSQRCCDPEPADQSTETTTV